MSAYLTSATAQLHEREPLATTNRWKIRSDLKGSSNEALWPFGKSHPREETNEPSQTAPGSAHKDTGLCLVAGCLPSPSTTAYLLAVAHYTQQWVHGTQERQNVEGGCRIGEIHDSSDDIRNKAYLKPKQEQFSWWEGLHSSLLLKIVWPCLSNSLLTF